MFDGRARRREFWMFCLFSFIISIILSIVDSVLGNKIVNGYGSSTGILGSIFSLVVLIPSLAVTVRRLHDTNHSGWWWFLMLIPIIGWIVILVFLFTDSTPGDNKYGPNPKGMTAVPDTVTG